jgi:hypothetical protein
VNAASGDVVWKSSSPGDGFTILVDGYLIITTKQGTLHAVKAHSDKYHELAGLQLFNGQAWTPPSFADGRIYARSLTEIACVEIVTGEQVGPARENSELLDVKLALAN